MEPAYVPIHLEEDRDHWWFRGRQAVIVAVLRRMLEAGRHRLLDIGCGSGNVLAAVERFGDVVGIEPDPALAAAARRAGFDVRSGALPHDLVVPAGWPDVVLMLDVLEHLDDDEAALRSVHAVLAPGGTLVATVPAYPWLWSGHDVVLGHRRRYRARGLRELVERADFHAAYVTYFNTLLLPGVALVRRWKAWRGDHGHDLRRPPAAVSALLGRVFALEANVVPRVGLPCGTSLLVVGRKPRAGRP